MKLHAATRATPAGPFRLVFSRGVLVGATFEDGRDWLDRHLGRRYGAFETAPADALCAPSLVYFDAYLAGDVAALDAIPADPAGTPFQKRVWAELRAIPGGAAISYGELARRVGDPKAVRAVAAANGANPVPIVIPCHRVVAADGSLHGYAGGLVKKRSLLEHERAAFRPGRGNARLQGELGLFAVAAAE